MLAALARTAPCRRPQTPLLIARLLPQPPLPLLSLRCWSSAAPPPQQQPSQQPQNHQQQQPAQQPDANNVGKGATLTPSAPSRLSSAALRALDPLRSAIPAASPSIFTFFSNTEIHKRCSKEGERNATERDPDVGALKSRQKHDRHDAVVGTVFTLFV
ncbi:hypothetical protein BC828DRAFT_376864 [Blastocladiella britannica]|nr:hypothetical protein BC828DRAFT_376864 [Blastocladiella britannica]